MFVFDIKGKDGSSINPVQKTGTAAQHYAWCVSQAVDKLNASVTGSAVLSYFFSYSTVDAIQTFASCMREREDTGFIIRVKPAGTPEGRIQQAIRIISERGVNHVEGIQSCTILTLGEDVQENRSSQGYGCLIS